MPQDELQEGKSTEGYYAELAGSMLGVAKQQSKRCSILLQSG